MSQTVPEPKGELSPDSPREACTKIHFHRNPERFSEGSDLAALYGFLDPGDEFVEHVLYWSLGNESQEFTGL